MAHLFIDCSKNWVALLLYGDALVRRPEQDPIARPLVSGEPLAGRIVLRCTSGDGAKEKWLLFAPPQAGVRVNSQPLVTGVRVLSDRDEILLRRAEPFF